MKPLNVMVAFIASVKASIMSVKQTERSDKSSGRCQNRPLPTHRRFRDGKRNNEIQVLQRRAVGNL